MAITWRSMRPLSRSILLAGVLAAAVLLGLLTMHGHAGPGGTTQPSATVHASTTLVATASQTLESTEAPLSCASCVESSTGLLMACMFALLAALGILILPGRFLVRAWLKPWRTVALRPTTDVLPRPPSLHMLCISRR